MKCTICRHGETHSGETTVTFDRGRGVIVFRGVPAQVCGNCGEVYLDEATTSMLLRSAEEAVANGVEVDVRQFPAA